MEREKIINRDRLNPVEGSLLELLNSLHEDMDRFTQLLDGFAARQEEALKKGRPVPLAAWPKVRRWMTRLRERAAFRTLLFKSYESGVWVVWDADPDFRGTCVLCLSDVEKDWYANCFRHGSVRARVEFARWALRIGHQGGEPSHADSAAQLGRGTSDWVPPAAEREKIINSSDAMRMGGSPSLWAEQIEKSLKTLEFHLLECESSQRDALKDGRLAPMGNWDLVQSETKQASILVAFVQSLCEQFQSGEFVVWEPPEDGDDRCDHGIYASYFEKNLAVETLEKSGIIPFIELARRVLVLEDNAT